MTEICRMNVNPFVNDSDSGCIDGIPYFIIKQENPLRSLLQYFNDILHGKDVNLIKIGRLIRECSYRDIAGVYSMLNDCSCDNTASMLAEIKNIITIQKNSNELFKSISELIIRTLENYDIINKLIVDNYCVTMGNLQRNRIIEVVKQEVFATASIWGNKINDVEIVKILDNNIGDDLHHVIIMGKIISFINMKYMSQFHSLSSVNHNLKETKRLFLENIDRLNYDVCIPFIKLFGIDQTFIGTYDRYLSKRILRQRDIQVLEQERRLIGQLNVHTDNDKKYIANMYEKIKDAIYSLKLMNIFIKNTNINVVSDEFKGVPIEKEICKFSVANKFVWDIKDDPNTVILPNYLKIYPSVISKIHELDNSHDELHIDSRMSTGIINIFINDVEYNFLVTLQQLVVLLQILNEKTINFDTIQKNTGLTSADLDSVLDSLYSFELINFEDDMYTINGEFAFKDTDISLLNTLDYKEKFDERLVLDIANIILQRKDGDIVDVEYVFNKYIEFCGVTNYDVIDSTLRYLEKRNMIEKINGSYVTPHKLYEEIDKLLL